MVVVEIKGNKSFADKNNYDSGKKKLCMLIFNRILRSLFVCKEVKNMRYDSGVARKPAIFVSSTCFDLKQIRQDIRDFIEDDLGYEAVLSEYDSFPIDPDIDTVENCLRVVEERADILVLIVGGRYGYITSHGDKSITNLEYLRAKAKRIPIFVFMDQSIINLLPVWESIGDYSKVVDSPKVFEFADTLRNKDNNWVHEFNSAKDIINCLRRQLAYLVNDSLCLRKHIQKENITPNILKYSGRVFELVVEKPRYWEYLLFAAVLKENLDKMLDIKLDTKYGIFFKNTKYFDEPEEIIDYTRAKCKDLCNRTALLDKIINAAFQEAVGEPGESGNAEYIIYVAEKIIEVDRSIHEWALDFKSIIVPEGFQTLLLYASQLNVTVIEDIENFILDYDIRINQLVSDVGEQSEKRKETFSLTLRVPDMKKINMEIARLEKKLL